MDRKLVDWGRAAKGRQRSQLPTLWLFTDEVRLPDPLPAIARLPKGAGLVFRHDPARYRASLGKAVARLCRIRSLTLVVAGNSRLAAALGAGLHMRDGRRSLSRFAVQRRGAVLTSSAHDLVSLRRASQAGAAVVFLSPAFRTESHPGQPALGPLRWNRLARQGTTGVAALGGIDGSNVRRLSSRACAAVGAIGALALDQPVARRSQCFPIAMRTVPEPLRHTGQGCNMPSEGRTVADSAVTPGHMRRILNA